MPNDTSLQNKKIKRLYLRVPTTNKKGTRNLHQLLSLLIHITIDS